jgi:hypothetical protein
VARLSILIPCLGGAAEFDGTLISVLQNRPADCEILVVHTADYADPYGLTGEVDFLRCPDPPSLVGLINAGLKQAAGEIVHVLACGLESTEGWTEPALAQFADPAVAAVAPVVTNVSGVKVVSAGMRYSVGGRRCVRRNRGLLASSEGQRSLSIGAPTLPVGFYRRDVLVAFGGFNLAAGDHLADAVLAVFLQDLELRTAIEPASRIVQVIDPLALASDSGYLRGRINEQLFWRTAGRTGLLRALPWHVLEVARDLPALIGRLAALVDWGAADRHRRRLAAAAARLEELRSQSRATLPLPAQKPRHTQPQKPRRKAA